ncbi:MAG: amino acid ABC transporter ATP-binding protein [Pleomorphochaeta sp.]
MRININNLNKTYDSHQVLKDINIEIKDVKVVGIIGSSGCGKSTLLRHLAYIEEADNGEIIINGLKLENKIKKDFQSEISYVFQEHSLFPHLSVSQNISLILEKIKKISKDKAKERVDSLLKEFSLENVKDKTPEKISGGQAQRASIARAFATNPNVMFLDEPTSALDPLLTKEVLSSIKTLKDKGMEFVLVTHEMNFLKKVADYYIFMEDGYIIDHGSTNEINKSKSKRFLNFINH